MSQTSILKSNLVFKNLSTFCESNHVVDNVNKISSNISDPNQIALKNEIKMEIYKFINILHPNLLN